MGRSQMLTLVYIMRSLVPRPHILPAARALGSRTRW